MALLRSNPLLRTPRVNMGMKKGRDPSEAKTPAQRQETYRPLKTAPCSAQEVRRINMAVISPPPTNKAPAAADSRGTPPVSGSTPALALGLEEAPDVAEAVGVALAVEVALEEGLATKSSPVGLSSKARSRP